MYKHEDMVYGEYGNRQDEFGYLGPVSQRQIIEHCHTIANLMNEAKDQRSVPAKQAILPVRVLVSQPYTKVAGGYTGMRPVGLRRTYTATVNGVFFMNENKSTFMVNIRHYCNREELPRPVFTFEQSEC